MDAIKTAQRVCEVFELFESERKPLRLKDFIERHGYPPSSASVLLKSLVRLGYLEYDHAARTYFPTMRMPAMVGWLEKARFGNGIVLAAMQRLRDATQEMVTLGVQSDLYAQYVYQLKPDEGHSDVPFQRGIRPLARSGLGWLLLSVLDDEAIRHLVRRINQPWRRSAGNPVKFEEEVMPHVREVRRDGFVFAKHTHVKGAAVIGMLIPAEPSARQLALCVHGSVEDLEAKQGLILEQLRVVCGAAAALNAGRARPPNQAA